MYAYLRDTLAVLSAVEDGPGDAAGVLSLQEERLRLAVLESEDLAVAADVELTLQGKTISLRHNDIPGFYPNPSLSSHDPDFKLPPNRNDIGDKRQHTLPG